MTSRFPLRICLLILILTAVPLLAIRAEEPTRGAEAAEIEVMNEYEVGKFEPGEKLFLDRPHTLKEAPRQLAGQKFIRGSIECLSFRCTSPGVVTVLTADSDDPRAGNLASTLEGYGFTPDKEQKAFLLFGTSAIDRVRVYRKQAEKGDEYRLGKWALLVGPGSVSRWVPPPTKPWSENDGELLYNGIRLPREWPPRSIAVRTLEPINVPYLDHPPKVIPIDLGRQLFVDDFLIEETDLKRSFHKAKKSEGNPVLSPETEMELNRSRNAVACPKSGGVWWDPEQKLFRMWYEAGWLNAICTATSRDGIHWDRPKLDAFPGSNRVLDPTIMPDSWAVFPDYEDKDPKARWKMFLHGPDGMGLSRSEGLLMVSPDGIHWTKPIESGPTGDRSTMFYNPFRKKWVFSIRWSTPAPDTYRSRHYWERDDFLKGPKWDAPFVGNVDKPNAPVFWARADRLDPPDPKFKVQPQLYNLDAVAYESIMLGIFEIYRNPGGAGLPKITELNLAYSRDGFHWSRPDRDAFIPASRSDVWDRGYVQSVGGVCVIQDDQLWFYYTGFQGNPAKAKRHWTENGEYDRGSTGVAFLRRDGFVSMDADDKTRSLTTRPVTFSGQQLFVNIDAPNGELRVEVLDESGNVIPPFSKENCAPVSIDKTRQMISWNGAEDLSALAGKPVKFRFYLSNGKLFSFWVSPDRSGASNGYVAAGGPDFSGLRDSPR